MPNQLYIIGGGYSVQEGIRLGLWDKLKDKFTIGLNCSYSLFPSTFVCFADPIVFYERYLEDLKKLPLVVGRYAKEIEKIKTPNTVLLKHNDREYTRNLSRGVYHSYLAGLFALSIGIYLLDEGEIFLLGFDGGALPPGSRDKKTLQLSIKGKMQTFEVEDVTDKLDKLINPLPCIASGGRTYRIITHWYQDKVDHKGIGKVPFYYTGTNDKFDVYKQESKIKIYNVSPNSRLMQFEKIDYSTMFKKMREEPQEQMGLRGWCRNKLEKI